MTRSDSIERHGSGIVAGGDQSASARAMAQRRRELIVTGVFALLIGICIGILAVHLLGGSMPGFEGQWRNYIHN